MATRETSAFAREVGLRFSPDGTTQTITATTTEIAQIGKFSTITLRDIVLPLTYYNINSSNNTILLKEDAGAWNIVTLTEGNYSAAQFTAEVKAELEAIGAGTYTVTISPITGLMTIAVSGGATVFSMAFTEGNRQSEKIWGVPEGTPGADVIIENPPSAAQINNVAAGTYTSTRALPSVVVINARNNIFILYLTGYPTWLQLTLTSGTYTRVQFASMLNTILSTAGINWTITINSNGTLTITIIPALGVTTFSIAFNENIRDIEEIWGVAANTPGANRIIQNPPTDAQINDTPAASYTSLRPVILWGPDQLLLRSAVLEKLTLFKNTDVSTGIQNIVTKIPVAGMSFSQYISTNTPAKQVIANSTLPASIDIGITDESGNNINFNGGICYINMVVQ